MTSGERDLFAGLPTPKGPGVYSATLIPGGSAYRLARSSDGRPTLLIDVAQVTGIPSLIDLRSQHVSVHHGRRCEVKGPDEVSVVGTFSLITCLSDDALIQGYFLDFVDTLVHILGERPTVADISNAVDSVIELFAALRQVPRTTVQGAWAELLLIARAQDPVTVAMAWHRSATDTYDFNAGSCRIEVKSSSIGDRRHHFSWEQLSPPQGVELLIASVFVEPAAGGTSIRDLMERIRVALAERPEVLQHTERTIAQTLGEAMLNALDQPQDEERAADSLRFYRSDDVPRPATPFPQGVSHVAFISDVALAPPVDDDWMASRGDLFAAAPTRNLV